MTFANYIQKTGSLKGFSRRLELKIMKKKESKDIFVRKMTHKINNFYNKAKK